MTSSLMTHQIGSRDSKYSIKEETKIKPNEQRVDFKLQNVKWYDS